MQEPYYIIEAKTPPVPIIISIPHCGTEFPKDLLGKYIPEQIKNIDDTDWFLQDLYKYAPEMGITIIHAKYHRWVIDLNRDPNSAPLYNDGRIITGLTSSTDFLGNPIYNKGNEPDKMEIERRLKAYYWPYYRKIEDLLAERKERFGKVLLWDAHSIRESVPTIQKENFPQMILGNNDEQTAAPYLIKTALESLRMKYQVSHNTPFKGGHITRYFGNPKEGIHALQLERNKVLYMDDGERNFDETRANIMRDVQKQMFKGLIDDLNS